LSAGPASAPAEPSLSAWRQRLKDAGLATFEENDTSCCYALQDKVWVHGPGAEPWEVYVVKADADTLGKVSVLGPNQASCACQQDDQTTTAAERQVEPITTSGRGCC
jgi:hypothetical protein